MKKEEILALFAEYEQAALECKRLAKVAWL